MLEFKAARVYVRRCRSFTRALLLVGTALAAHPVLAAAPAISGTPPTTVMVGSNYVFSPVATDADGDALTFSVANKPVWAYLTQAGRLAGVPPKAGTWSNIVIRVSDGNSTVALPAFSITAVAQPVASSVPTITGTPPTTVMVGSNYVFSPVATDTDGDPLTFSITNKPIWAYLTQAGRLAGVPPKAGTWSNIVIRVSDGNSTVALPAFSITAVAQPVASSVPTITGTPPTSVVVGSNYVFSPVARDADGDPLTFSITNKPIWAYLTQAGRLAGVPPKTGTWSNIVIRVTDGKSSVALPAFSITAVASSINNAPTITGTPPKAVNYDSYYSFRPTASDPEGAALTFSIANRPAWASFNTASGQLFGTPEAADVGTYSNIVISASDGVRSTALPGFAIAVNQMSMGSVTLSWAAPTQNTDGTTLTNLAGYRICYGTSPSSLTQSIQVTNPGSMSYVIGNLPAGTYYFAVKAYSSSSVESDYSTIVSKTVAQ